MHRINNNKIGYFENTKMREVDIILQYYNFKQQQKMKTKLLMVATTEMSTSTGYIIGAIIALAILGYLIYTLIKPEKF